MNPANDDDPFLPAARLKACREAMARLSRGICEHPDCARGLARCLNKLQEDARRLQREASR